MTQEYVDEQTGEVVQVSPTAIEQIERSQLQVQIEAAQRRPRMIKRFMQQATALATHNSRIAESCFYRLSRGGKLIEGPSVRLAEIAATAWGNLTVGARIISEDDKTVTAQGVARDLETNMAMSVEVSRRITDKRGRKFSDDMIIVTKNAACAIAYRNAVLKVIPAAFLEDVLEQAQRVALGEGEDTETRVARAMKLFGEFGVQPGQVLAAVDKSAVAEITPDDLLTLIGLYNAIKGGDTTVEEAFPHASLEEKQAAVEAKMQAAKDAKDQAKSSSAKKPDEKKTE